MTTATAYQASFFTNEELLPYKETLTAHGERFTAFIYKGDKPNDKGEMILHAGYEWRHGGMLMPCPVDSDIPKLIAELKEAIARLEHV